MDINYTDGSDISIHSLRMEGDIQLAIRSGQYKKISIHSLRMEGDGDFFNAHTLCFDISIHSLRMEGDRRAL